MPGGRCNILKSDTTGNTARFIMGLADGGMGDPAGLARAPAHDLDIQLLLLAMTVVSTVDVGTYVDGQNSASFSSSHGAAHLTVELRPFDEGRLKTRTIPRGVDAHLNFECKQGSLFCLYDYLNPESPLLSQAGEDRRWPSRH